LANQAAERYLRFSSDKELTFPSEKHEGIVTLGFSSRKTFHLETSSPGRLAANDRLFALRGHNRNVNNSVDILQDKVRALNWRITNERYEV